MGQERYYLGIDLGTTNSCVHWGALDPVTGRIQPRELSFDQLVEKGNLLSRVLLPSVVWFEQAASAPTVGEYARVDGMMAQPSRVVRSVKNEMGRRGWRFEVDGRAYSAAEISASILRTLREGIFQTWGFYVDEAIITVPASFDSDMRDDTFNAAQMAGFNVLNADGSRRNILLDEPRAALYDLVNRHAGGDVPPDVISFDQPKTVMVFDLGGGTLDVSLHTVQHNPAAPLLPMIDDLAISRYTQIGGDTFDRRLMNALLMQFQARNTLNVSALPLMEQRVIEMKLLNIAEDAKRRLTSKIEQLRRTGQPITDAVSVPIQAQYVYDRYNLFTQLTKRDFEDAIRPLLGESLTLDDLERVDQIDYAQVDNIIYPILDVLHKAGRKLGAMPTIDAVILNGGMTRVHAVRERLQQFTGVAPLSILDADKSVSRGAVVYHYLLTQGLRPKSVLAETIGVEVLGNRVHHLLPAGTVLPTRRQFTGLFEVPYDAASSLQFPLYRGERTTPEPPNVKLAQRNLVLTRRYTAGTSLDVEIAVDENKVVQFAAWLTHEPTQRVEIRAASDATFAAAPPESPRPARRVPPPPISGGRLNLQAIGDRVRFASDNFDIQDFKLIHKDVMTAENNHDVIEHLINMVPQLTYTGRERLYIIFGDYLAHFPDSPLKGKIVSTLVGAIKMKHTAKNRYLNTALRQAVIALGRIGSGVAESDLLAVLNQDHTASIRADLLHAIGRVGGSFNAVKYVQIYISSESVGDRIAAYWSLGRLLSRERERPIPIAQLREIQLLPTLLVELPRENHLVAQKHCIYALGEMGDRRFAGGDMIDAGEAQTLIEGLETLRAYWRTPRNAQKSGNISEVTQLIRWLELAMKMARGEQLQDAETTTLIGIRTLIQTVSSAAE
jgi:molecular chaperone DnaK (HSP70)